MTQITLNTVEAESGAVTYDGDATYAYATAFGSGTPPSLTTGLPATKIAFFTFDISEATTGKTPAQIAAALTAGCSLKFNLPTAIHSGEGVEVGVRMATDSIGPYSQEAAEDIYYFLEPDNDNCVVLSSIGVTASGDKEHACESNLASISSDIAAHAYSFLIIVLTNIALDVTAHEFRRHSVGHVQLLLGPEEIPEELPEEIPEEIPVEIPEVEETEETETHEIISDRTETSYGGCTCNTNNDVYKAKSYGAKITTDRDEASYGLGCTTVNNDKVKDANYKSIGVRLNTLASFMVNLDPADISNPIESEYYNIIYAASFSLTGAGPYTIAAAGFNIADTQYTLNELAKCTDCTLKAYFNNSYKNKIYITMGAVHSSYQFGGSNVCTDHQFFDLIHGDRVSDFPVWQQLGYTQAEGNTMVLFNANTLLTLKTILKSMDDTDWLYVGFRTCYTYADYPNNTEASIYPYGYPRNGSIKLVFEVPSKTLVISGQPDIIKETRHGATIITGRTSASYGTDCGAGSDTFKVKAHGAKIVTNRDENSYGV